MSYFKKFLCSFLCIAFISQSFLNQTVTALAFSPIPFIILSEYDVVTDIGDEFYLIAVTSNGKSPNFKSSNTKVASVNTYGLITAKKAGSAVITAKIKDAEASCRIVVNKTKISLSSSKAAIEHGETLKLKATTSNGSQVTWKSSKKSIAIIDEYGLVTGLKPGETTITASADGSSATCILTVKSPTIHLNKSAIKLYRGQTFKLTASVSSNLSPSWKTNKKSVALVDSDGTVKAVKNGTAVITATVDGVSKTCEVIVMKPDISLSCTELTLKKGAKTIITATVSSKNLPQWSSSNSNVVSVNSRGEITAIKKGTAYIYVTEDGTKVRCTIHVTE